MFVFLIYWVVLDIQLLRGTCVNVAPAVQYGDSSDTAAVKEKAKLSEAHPDSVAMVVISYCTFFCNICLIPAKVYWWRCWLHSWPCSVSNTLTEEQLVANVMCIFWKIYTNIAITFDFLLKAENIENKQSFLFCVLDAWFSSPSSH